VNLRRANEGDKLNFWAALDRDGQVLGVGSHKDALDGALKKGVAAPILWRVVESFQYEDKGIKIVPKKEGGVLSVELEQTCPKCKTMFKVLMPKCDRCGYIIFPHLV
jgi:hypothetical protein